MKYWIYRASNNEAVFLNQAGTILTNMLQITSAAAPPNPLQQNEDFLVWTNANQQGPPDRAFFLNRTGNVYSFGIQ